jgi:hypothetical protein
MTAPGISFSSISAPPPSTTAPRTGLWFVTGLTERGPVGRPVLLQSMSDYATKFGGRVPAGTLYDALDQYFRDGGVQAYVSRVVGPAAATATKTLMDGAGSPLATLTVTALGAGVWGNALSVQVTHPTASTYQLIFSTTAAGVVETSPVLSTPADAVSWSTQSNYVTITNENSATATPLNNPAVLAATALTAGADDNAGITETQWTNALTTFTADLGPGQISAPGRTTDPAHVALTNHATANNRVALLDPVDTATAATLITAAGAIATGGADPTRATLCAPWVILPGISTGGAIPPPTRTVPPSALVAARCCSVDQDGNPALAAAGPNGHSFYAVGVTQTYIDSDRASLNLAGVSLIRSIAGVVQLYGFRSLSPDPQWMQLGRARLRMAIQDRAVQAGAAIQFGQLDNAGRLLSAWNGALRGILTDYWQLGALYGASASDAFSVNTGPQVNTVDTMAAGYANAVLQIKPAGVAEFIAIVLQSVPLSQAISAA